MGEERRQRLRRRSDNLLSRDYATSRVVLTSGTPAATVPPPEWMVTLVGLANAVVIVTSVVWSTVEGLWLLPRDVSAWIGLVAGAVFIVASVMPRNRWAQIAAVVTVALWFPARAGSIVAFGLDNGVQTAAYLAMVIAVGVVTLAVHLWAARKGNIEHELNGHG